jgi:hypothetical protein
MPFPFPAGLLFGLLTSTGAVVLGLLGLLGGRSTHIRPVLFLLALLLVLGGTVAFFAVSNTELWQALLVLAGSTLVLAVLRCPGLVAVCLNAVLALRHPWIPSGALFLVGTGGLLGQMLWLEQGMEMPDPFADLGMLAGQLQLIPSESHQAFTDAGNPIPLYLAYLPEAAAQEKIRQFDAIRHYRLEHRVMQMEQPEQAYNCHGWIFTGGRCWVRGASVPQILADNHYVEVAQPQAGDLAIYRRPDGQIAHTGLVRLLVEDGTILIEGQWGMAGRYLHGPRDHCYSDCSCTWYHTDRGSHLLRGFLPQRLKDGPSGPRS